MGVKLFFCTFQGITKKIKEIIGLDNFYHIGSQNENYFFISNFQETFEDHKSG